mmetsp:Transcript_8263/g.22768  ORF Transcript_8263/g.22768 Transcript_8263/m.22768 type:complete len:233 (+) Transcript_8263:1-699(+)
MGIFEMAFSALILGCSAASSVRLHGTPQSRSPLVNWYAAEAGIPLEMRPPLPSKHPFTQVPFLEDDGGVEVFESGACLLYLADKADPEASPAERAKYTKWVMWANSELDGLCFGAVPGDHRVRGTSLDKPNVKSLDRLNQIMEGCEWLVDDSFSVADVAVGSYLNYVPVFFPSADLSARKGIVSYMRRCAERDAFGEAFGEGHQGVILQKTSAWLDSPSAAGPASIFKKMIG